MSLKDTINDAMKDAMRTKDEVRLTTLRSVRAEILKKEKEKAGSEAGDDVVTQAISRMVKQRRESIEQFEKAGRDDLAAREKAELAVLESFMPAGLSEAEIDAIVREVIAATGAAGPGDLGKIMGQVMKACAASGKAVDGKLANQRTRALLGA